MKGHVSGIQQPAFSLNHLWHVALERPARWLQL